ncbi:MAG: TolB family protein, partial [Acidobacteriota bacterium]
MVLSLLLPAGAVSRTHEESRGGEHLTAMDVFQLEYASDPRISPSGKRIVYVRNFMDIMKDQRRSNLWILNTDGSQHRPLTTGNRNDSSPRWSPDGKRLLYISSIDGSTQIYLRWMDSGQTAKLTSVTTPPSDLAWSRNGRWIAFTMRVPEKRQPLAKMPSKPEGAQWAKPARVIDKLIYRADGAGYLKDGYTQVFILPADG